MSEVTWGEVTEEGIIPLTPRANDGTMERWNDGTMERWKEPKERKEERK